MTESQRRKILYQATERVATAYLTRRYSCLSIMFATKSVLGTTGEDLALQYQDFYDFDDSVVHYGLESIDFTMSRAEMRSWRQTLLLWFEHVGMEALNKENT